MLVSVSRAADVGPLQALIDELALNAKIAARADSPEQGARFHDAQLRRTRRVRLSMAPGDIREARTRGRKV